MKDRADYGLGRSFVLQAALGVIHISFALLKLIRFLSPTSRISVEKTMYLVSLLQ